MRVALRAVGVGVLAAGFSLAVVAILAVPAGAGVTQAGRSGRAGAGSVTAWSARASLMLAGRLDLILRLVRCPTIKNYE